VVISPSEADKQVGEQRRAHRQLLQHDMFVGGVGAVAGHAQAVQGGDAERGGEVAVRAAAQAGCAKSQERAQRFALQTRT